MQDETERESIRIWWSVLPSERDLVDELAQDVTARLQTDRWKVRSEFGFPHAADELCVFVATPAALSDTALFDAWKHLVKRGHGPLVGLSEPGQRWPKFLEQRVERFPLDPDGDGAYRIDLSKIISKYIGETEKNLGG